MLLHLARSALGSGLLKASRPLPLADQSGAASVIHRVLIIARTVNLYINHENLYIIV